MDNVFTSSIMSKQQDFVFLSKLMANANMGWWEANLATECYTCSEYISEILNLDETGTISFEDINKRILKEEQGKYDCVWHCRNAGRTGYCNSLSGFTT